jgi:23S rRNA (adenine2503-C2)-methyltransferase
MWYKTTAMTDRQESFYRYTLGELDELFRRRGLPETGPALLYNWHHKKKRVDPCVDDLAKVSRAFVGEHFDFVLPEIRTARESADRTVKFLFALRDGLTVESVLIPFNNKYTLCLSSQVGCAMKCSFCHTGTQGLTRHLEAEEIVGQYIGAARWLSKTRPGDDKILNVVFMGQGEPLHNFDAVKKAAVILLERRGIGLAPHKITISTAGYLPGLRRWKAEMPSVNIAVSLHSPLPEKRDQLIPLNQRYPIDEVVAFAEEIPEGRMRFVTYEVLLIKGFNDAEEDAHLTGRYLANRKAFVSLIPFNPFPGTEYARPGDAAVERFKRVLDSYLIPTTIRKTKGDEILAACGQLNSRFGVSAAP